MEYFEKEHQKLYDSELDKLFDGAQTCDWTLAQLHLRSLTDPMVADRLSIDKNLTDRLTQTW